MPGEFALEHALGLNAIKLGFGPRDFEKWSKVILMARDQQSLEVCNVRFGHILGKQFGFSFKVVADQHEAQMMAHQRELQALRQGELEIPPTREKWAATILKSLETKPEPEVCKQFGSTLDAAYKYDLDLWDLVVSSNYNLKKNRTDWIDQQQLYYLADSRMRFLTTDSTIKARTKKSIQCDRILVYSEFRDST